MPLIKDDPYDIVIRLAIQKMSTNCRRVFNCCVIDPLPLAAVTTTIAVAQNGSNMAVESSQKTDIYR